MPQDAIPGPPAGTPASDAASDGWSQVEDYGMGRTLDTESRRDAALERTGLPILPSTPAGLPDLGAMREAARRVPTTATTARPERNRTTTVFSFWRGDGSAEQDAEVMARIMAGKQERDEEARSARDRVAVAMELERRDRARTKQRIAIEMHLAAQIRRAVDETPLQRVLRETADIFLALGICPDHLEWLPETKRFCSWGGKLYDHAALHAMRDRHGRPLYVLGDSAHGQNTVCWSPRERGWRLDRPLDPTGKLTPIDRLLPVPQRHDGGGHRHSAKHPGTLLMEEGLATVYIVGNGVLTLSHLQAAHHRHGREATPPVGAPVVAGTSLLERIADGAVSATTRLLRRHH